MNLLDAITTHAAIVRLAADLGASHGAQNGRPGGYDAGIDDNDDIVENVARFAGVDADDLDAANDDCSITDAYAAAYAAAWEVARA